MPSLPRRAAPGQGDLDTRALKDWCRSRLGRHELPRRIELVDALPKNAAGKTSSASCAARASTSAGCHHGWHLNVDDGHWRVRFGGHCVEFWRASATHPRPAPGDARSADEVSQVWVMLHSGSRGIGNAIGTYFIELARRDMERWFIQLPDRDLAHFPEGSAHFDDYVTAVSWAQADARENRDQMMALVLAALGWPAISRPLR